MTLPRKSSQQTESGNVLFLILIAVVLFAALAYAVTQSTRGAGGGAQGESALVEAAQVTQYPATIRVAVNRMVIAGAEITDLEFNPPSTFGSLSAPAVGVFHPDGGGATYSTSKISSFDFEAEWKYNLGAEIQNVGTSSPGSLAGNDLVAFLMGVPRDVCLKINQEHGISADIPVAPNFNYISVALSNMDNAYALPAGETVIGSSANAALAPFDGMHFGCYALGTVNIYFHVLYER